MPETRKSRIFGGGDGDQFSFLRRLQWEKITIWALFVLTVWFLRKFFAAIFLTFIFGYIGHRVVRWICLKLGHDEPASKTWRITLIGVFLSFAGVVTGMSLYVAPRIWDQARQFQEKVFGPVPGSIPTPPSAPPKAPPPAAPPNGTPAPAPENGAKPKPTREIVITPQQLERVAVRMLPAGWAGRHPAEFQQGLVWVTGWVNDNIPAWQGNIGRAVGGVIGFALSFMLAYIFSFFILWDLPKLAAKVRALGDSNLGRIYNEIAPGMIAFGGGMGQAFQAQTVIALLNTLLTLVGLLILGIPMPDVLSLIVFLCSFIPVVGMIISTVPIALIAVAQIGPGTMLLAIGMVAVIHFVEAYILNPRIYGHVMHMPPLIVLIILIIAESLFGLWGVILGVPTCQFVFNYWIRRAKAKEAAEGAEGADGGAPGDTAPPPSGPVPAVTR